MRATGATLNIISRAACGTLMAILMWTSFTAGATAQSAGNADSTDSRIAKAMAGYDRFSSTHSVDDLRKTAFALISVVDQRALRTGDVVGHRRSIVAAYAKVLRQLDAVVDPAFDPSELPSLCVTPPREPNGRQAPACADPKDVLDPVARAQYQATIDANSARIRHHNEQAQIVNAASDTMSLLEIALHRFHDRSPADTAALDDILLLSGLGEARRAKIHTMF